MPLRSLSPKEIESFIDEDRIVWAACRSPQLDLTQGKFVKGKSLEEGSGESLYSFCVFKKGVKTGFLPAHHWLIDEDGAVDTHDETVNETLAKMFAKK